MPLRESAVEIHADLEYPACPLCGNDRHDFPFRLSAIGRIRRGEHELYRVARCVECGFSYLYPRLIESAMQEVYRESA
jgi:predicted nucleic-acid-binding Zn-ribbon protein